MSYLRFSGARTYQADLGAEAHVLTIQSALQRPFRGMETYEPAALVTEKWYLESVRLLSQVTEGNENRISYPFMGDGKQTGETMDAVYRSCNYDTNKLVEAAKKRGIIIEGYSNDIAHNWLVESPDGSRFAFKYGDPEITSLPRGTNGIETFRAFKVPDDAAIRSVFDRVRPVLEDLQPQIRAISKETAMGATLRQLLDDIPVRHIRDRMNGGAVALEISTTARLNAQLARAEPPSIPEEPRPSLQEMRDRLVAQSERGRMKPEPGTGARDPHAELRPSRPLRCSGSPSAEFRRRGDARYAASALFTAGRNETKGCAACRGNGSRE